MDGWMDIECILIDLFITRSINIHIHTQSHPSLTSALNIPVLPRLVHPVQYHTAVRPGKYINSCRVSPPKDPRARQQREMVKQ